MVRIVRRPDGEVVIDETDKMPGRGAYLCRNRQCWLAALEKRRIGHALKSTLTDQEYAQIETFASQFADSEAT